LDQQCLDELLTDQEAAIALFGAVARNIRQSLDRGMRQKLGDCRTRAASTICLLADQLGVHQSDRLVVHHQLTHGELAQLSGMARETFSGCVRALIERGWLLSDRQSFVILDEAALRKRARVH
jgi:CRP-like cAMP-binding protein